MPSRGCGDRRQVSHLPAALAGSSCAHGSRARPRAPPGGFEEGSRQCPRETGAVGRLSGRTSPAAAEGRAALGVFIHWTYRPEK